MVKKVFDIIGYDYYKGLKEKLPPIRYIGKDENDNDMVMFAHPKDFYKQHELFKLAYSEFSSIQDNNENIIVSMEDKKTEILEIYPPTDDLLRMPNGFVGLFVNELGMNIINSEFNNNDEVNSLQFLPVTEDGIDKSGIKLCGVIETFMRKFNSKKHLINKYVGLFLVVGEINDIDIKSGITKPTNKFNIIGGKRTYFEDSINSTIREVTEELGLQEDSKMLIFINNMLPKTKSIIRCFSFNVFCMYYTPTNHELGQEV
jgi:hypothetical protein